MPDLAGRISAAGRWASFIALLAAATVCVKVAADERTVKDRLEITRNELARDRERNAAAHAASLADRESTKARQAAVQSAADRNAARIDALEKRLAALERALTRPESNPAAAAGQAR